MIRMLKAWREQLIGISRPKQSLCLVPKEGWEGIKNRRLFKEKFILPLLYPIWHIKIRVTEIKLNMAITQVAEMS